MPAKKPAAESKPEVKTKNLTLPSTDRDALVAKLEQAEQMFLGTFPAAAQPIIAEVRAALKKL